MKSYVCRDYVSIYFPLRTSCKLRWEMSHYFAFCIPNFLTVSVTFAFLLNTYSTSCDRSNISLFRISYPNFLNSICYFCLFPGYVQYIGVWCIIYPRCFQNFAVGSHSKQFQSFHGSLCYSIGLHSI